MTTPSSPSSHFYAYGFNKFFHGSRRRIKIEVSNNNELCSTLDHFYSETIEFAKKELPPHTQDRILFMIPGGKTNE